MARIAAARVRVQRPQTVVCVVGEFKQGKSLLCNALLGRPVCPVDDDLATSAITVVEHAPATEITVVRRVDGAEQRDRIKAPELPGYVTEKGNPGNHLGVEQVVIGLDVPLLADGIALVDTPGVGGLAAGHAAATKAFLPYADALLFVSDASAELSEPEVEFLAEAASRCATVVHVLTKTDLYGDWRRVRDLDAGHLARAGTAVPIHAVSAHAAVSGIRLKDQALVAESGIPELVALLRDEVLDRNRSRAVARAGTDVHDVLAVLATTCREEVRLAGEDGGAATDARQDLDEAVARLEHLKGPAARWSVRLADGMADISSKMSFSFRGGVRELTRTTDEGIEELSTPEEWEALAATVQDELAALIGATYAAIDEGTAALRAELAELIEIEVGEAVPRDRDIAGEVSEIWESRTRTITEQTKASKVGGGAVTAMRGAQSGIMLFSLLGRFVPAGAAALMFSNPVTMVLAVAFAGKTVLDAKKRTVMARRQQARANVRQFLDDAQFELTNQLADQVKLRQRELRDEFTDRLGELQRTYSDLATSARDNLQRSTAEREARRKDFEARLGTVTKVDAALTESLAASAKTPSASSAAAPTSRTGA